MMAPTWLPTGLCLPLHVRSPKQVLDREQRCRGRALRRAGSAAGGTRLSGKATSRAGQCLKIGPGTARSRRMVISEQSSSVTATEPRCRTAASSRHSLGRQPQPGQDRTGDGVQNRVHPCPGRAGDVDRTVIDK
jgi:hypothetical protein